MQNINTILYDKVKMYFGYLHFYEIPAFQKMNIF